MKTWQRYGAGILGGIAVGLIASWLITARPLGGGTIENGVWTTSLEYGLVETDALTRARVARGGLLALTASETIYWQAATDAEGRALDGDCTYALHGGEVDARWWSVTYYDGDGYLMDNPHDIWSFSGSAITPQQRDDWTVTISAAKPATGDWLPAVAGEAFVLTLRMYNPGPAFLEAPGTAPLPAIIRKSCA